MDQKDKLLCIYHHNCADGFAGAWVIRKFYGEENVEFFDGVYGQPAPDVTGRNVILVDFSYKKDVMEIMIEQSESLLVLDHHTSAEKELTTLPYSPNFKCEFDMQRSGAMIAWNWFFPELSPPALLCHIQDRDLWRFDLPGTKEIQASVFSNPYEFEVWDVLMYTNPEDLRSEGVGILRKHMKDINEFIAATKHELQIDGHVVPAINCPYFMGSDACAILCKDMPFAAYYYREGPDKIKFGLRSDMSSGGLDVSKIAVKLGGGGHQEASGFVINVEDFSLLDVAEDSEENEYPPENG